MAILAQTRPVYQPAMRIISSVTNSNPAVVTTTFNHQYLSGSIVRLNIPIGYGMVQANQLYAPIIVTGDTTFAIDLDTINFQPFVVPQDLGATDGAGNATGNVTYVSSVTGARLGQTFIIGTQIFTVAVFNGALQTTGTGVGTFNVTSGAFTFTGAAANTEIFYIPIPFPYSYQDATVTPIGEINSQLTAAVRNVLPYSAI